MMENKNIKIGFFGTSDYSVMVLEKLKDAGFVISFVVTQTDKPKGRDLVMTASPVKVWAEKENVPVLQPEKLRDPIFEQELRKFNADVYVVIAYGKIIPESILEIPKGKSLNIHASLLPRFRGSCPIETAILEDEKNTGVTIIKMDKEMDHGPILAKKEVAMETWPPKAHDLGKRLVEEGANLLIEILPKWLARQIEEIPQDHSLATFTKKIEKEDGLIDLKDDPYKNFLKIQAYHIWPRAFFYIEKNGKKVRVIITEASFADGILSIEKVIEEGKKEVDFKTWNNS